MTPPEFPEETPEANVTKEEGMNAALAEMLIRIVDDEADVRESLAFMLRKEGFEVAVYASAHEFLVNDMPSRPGCLLLDVRMDGMSGLELQEEMRKRNIQLPIVFLSAYGTIEMAVETMQKGAVAFVEKSADRNKVLEAIYRALERLPGSGDNADDYVQRWHTLTPREQDVAILVADGLLNREIAERLGIAPKTVQVHRSDASAKLGVRGVAQLTRALRLIDKVLHQA